LLRREAREVSPRVVAEEFIFDAAAPFFRRLRAAPEVFGEQRGAANVERVVRPRQSFARFNVVLNAERCDQVGLLQRR
jgi:hypothetical protein